MFSQVFFFLLASLFFQTVFGNNNATGCAAKSDCGSCTGDLDCVWCDSDKICQSGDYFGADCSGWQWGQCEADGETLLIVELCAIGVILLICLGCVIRCFCCRRRRRYDSQIDYTQLDTDPYPERSAHPKTDAQRARLQEKYGFSRT